MITPIKPWPVEDLETVDVCPVCGSEHRHVIHASLVDKVFGCPYGPWQMVQCHDCGSAYLSERPTAETIGLAYKTYYTHAQTDTPKPLSGAKKIIRAIMNGYRNRQFGLSLLPSFSLGYYFVRAFPLLSSSLKNEMRSTGPALQGQTLLDVGCGDGKFLALAQQMGWTVTGLEPDPSAASNTRAKGITVIEGDISALADQVACFDVITCSHVIEHVHDPVAVLQAMHRLLKPGGRLWIETPNINSFGHERYGEHWRGLEPPRHLVLFNVESLSKVLHTIGFHVDEADVNFFQVLFMNVTSQAIARAKEASNLSMFAGVSFANAWRMMQAYWYPLRREYITLMAVKIK